MLEWINFECAPVQAQYQAPGRTMQALQRAARARGVVWLSINSTGAGQRGYLTPKQCKEVLVRRGVFGSTATRVPGSVQLDDDDHRELDAILAGLQPLLRV